MLQHNLSKSYRICGVDEAGRGAWAGPLVASGVVITPEMEQKCRLRN